MHVFPMNIFSFFLIAYVLFVVVFSKSLRMVYYKLLVLTCVMEILNLQGYFLVIGNTEMHYESFCEWVLLFFSLIYLAGHKSRIPTSISAPALLFLISFLFSVLWELAFPYQGYLISWDLHLAGDTSRDLVVKPVTFILIVLTNSLPVMLNFVTTGIIVKRDYSKQDIRRIIHDIVKWCDYYLIYGVGEFIFKNIFHSEIHFTLVKLIFGAGRSTMTENQERVTGVNALQGLTREPSHFALSLMFIAILIIMDLRINENKRINKKFLARISVCMFLMLLCGAFTTALGLLIVLLFFVWVYIDDLKLQKKIFYSVCGIICVLIAAICLISTNVYLSYRLERLIDSITYLNNGTISTHSSFVRLYGISTLFKEVCGYNLFLGIGPGLWTAPSGIVTSLSFFGLLGTFLWFVFVTRKTKLSCIPFIIVIIFPNILSGIEYFRFSFTIIMIEAISCLSTIKSELILRVPLKLKPAFPSEI